MTLNITPGRNSKPVATKKMIDLIQSSNTFQGELITGFPILQSSDTIGAADGVLVSPRVGLVAFDIVEGVDLGDFESRQDDLVRKLQSRLLQYPDLVKRRQLIPEIHTVTFAPAWSGSEQGSEEYNLATSENLIQVLKELPSAEENPPVFRSLLSAIQSMATVGKGHSPRNVAKADSRGARLLQLEKSIATLDSLQSKAVIETVDGVQRIRGLAGSGKTVVLALKAAYLHTLNPNWKIAVTFNTRSLKDQFRRLIKTFFAQQTNTEPNWNNLKILNAWGSLGSTESGGLYSTFCETFNIPYHNFREASGVARSSTEAFDWACQNALESAGPKEKPIFDAILVDEAQDLPPEFLRLCYRMLGPEKRLVYAYDELQSLNGRGVPTPEIIFGNGPNGRPLVDLTHATNGSLAQDIVLQKCYRNSRPVLVTAHALGFGVYRPPMQGRESGLVQLFNNEELWSDIGYNLKSGEFQANKRVILERPEESSPRFLEQHSPMDDLVHFQTFNTVEEQNEWVATQIINNIQNDELKYDDIVVINPNGITARKNLAPLRAKLLERGIQNHLAGVDTSADEFFSRTTDSVTFTGIHRAKGNEAGMVYVVNAQEGLESVANLSAVRNRLFTAMTRSKAWVRVVGVGEPMSNLIEEFEQTKLHDFTLDFVYPSDSELDKINLVHREITLEQERTIHQRKKSAAQLLNDLENQRIFAEDLGEDVRARLLQMLRESDDV